MAEMRTCVLYRCGRRRERRLRKCRYILYRVGGRKLGAKYFYSFVAILVRTSFPGERARGNRTEVPCPRNKRNIDPEKHSREMSFALCDSVK